MDFTNMMLSAPGVKKIVEEFDVIQKQDKLYSDNSEIIKLVGEFSIPRKVFIDYAKKNLDMFPDIDTIIRVANKNRGCQYFVSELKKSNEEIIRTLEGMTPQERKRKFGSINLQEFIDARPVYDVDENSPIELKIEYILRFLDRAIIVGNLFPINGQKLFIEISDTIFTNEQILQMIPISEFHVDVDYCEWYLWEDDTLKLAFRYNN